MENKKMTVLILDDEVNFTEELQEYLEIKDFEAFTANTPAEGFKILQKKTIDLMILDVRLPGMSGIEILKDVKQTYPDMEVIIVSGHGDMDTVIQAMRNGAIDYLRKPFRHLDIQIAIERTQKYLKLFHKYKEMKNRSSLISLDLEQRIQRNFIGESKIIKEVLNLAITASQYPYTNVLITGESGTGKENVARIIHYSSPNKENAFVAVNSSAVPETLLESEFFGHKKGSFTGAIGDKSGFFEVANQGTLFLDEIADMPFNLQAKLLRALEEKRVSRIGGSEEINVELRIISATNHVVHDLVEQKKFRLDLLHRLNTVEIHIPPLRQRKEDIPLLLDFFLKEFAGKMNKTIPIYNPTLIDHLASYNFPGNVRELRNMVERAMIFQKGKELSAADFPLKDSIKKQVSHNDVNLNIEENEKRLIIIALERCDYNQNNASQILGISRDALVRRLKKYDIRIQKAM
ncbi:MAG: DNA-binding response regulator [Marinilabiliales bacterium]|nr:MAG: DNA-binding response regulator [Marinilabiliales bacterium]